jgi:hypothetical protein
MRKSKGIHYWKSYSKRMAKESALNRKAKMKESWNTRQAVTTWQIHAYIYRKRWNCIFRSY